MVDTTKKEIREIRAADAQMRWDMLREDKQDMMSAEKKALDEIQEWRQEQSEGIKALVAENERRTKIIELGESKAYQEFKRECKLNSQDDEIQHNRAAYLQDLENAAWCADLTRAANDREKDVLADHRESEVETRLIQSNLILQEKQDEAANRAFEQNLEMAKLMKELQQERFQAVENLAYTRAAYKNPRSSTARHQP